MLLGATGGTSGDPLSKGGRNGSAARGVAGTGAASSAASFFSGAFSTGFSATGAGAGATTGATIGAGFGASGAAVTTGAGALGAEAGVCTSGAPCSSGSAADSAARRGRVAPVATRSRTARTTSSSSELEWVFLSCTPNSGSRSRITVGFTSSSRASSLIRILLITGIASGRTRSVGKFCYSPFSATPTSALDEES